ncbi:MAG TPA: hypothetical protein VKR06_22000 [Ktedonosporobacter sp.]|nr:hypothetical protein [Ktedonosporobacter sp.]
MGMGINVTHAAVMAKQSFDHFTRQGMPIGSMTPFVFGIRFSDDKEMIGVKGVLQEQVVQQRHQFRGEINEAFLTRHQTFRQGAIFEIGSAAHPDPIAMKLQVLNEKAECLTYSESTLTHQKHKTTELEILYSGQECGEVHIRERFHPLLWLFE